MAIWTRGTPLGAARTVFRAAPGDAILNLDAAGAGKARVAVIQRAIDFSSFKNLIVRVDGKVEETPLPTAVRMTAHTLGGSDLIVQLGKAATIGGRTYPAESVIAYDVRATTPPAARVTLVYAPTDGEFITDTFSGFSVGGGKVRMIVTKRGVSRIVTATRTATGWTTTRGPAEAVGISMQFTTFDNGSGAALIERQGYLTPVHVALTGVGDKDLPLYTHREVVVVAP